MQTLHVKDHVLSLVPPTAPPIAPGTCRHHHRKGFCTMTQCTQTMRGRRAAPVIWGLSGADDWHHGGAISGRTLLSSASDSLSMSWSLNSQLEIWNRLLVLGERSDWIIGLKLVAKKEDSKWKGLRIPPAVRKEHGERGRSELQRSSKCQKQSWTMTQVWHHQHFARQGALVRLSKRSGCPQEEQRRPDLSKYFQSKL